MQASFGDERQKLAAMAASKTAVAKGPDEDRKSRQPRKVNA
jgi:hypothetical protein